MSNREEFEKAYTNAFIGEELKGLESIIFARFEIGGEYAQDKVATAYAMWQARVPEGYVVVPVEPSDYMKCTVRDFGPDIEDYENMSKWDWEKLCAEIYKSMIEAVEK